MATYRRIRSTRLLVIGLLVVSLVTITVDVRGGETGPLATFGRVGLAIITPLQKGLSAVVRPVGTFFSNVFRAGSLAEENEQLRSQLRQVAGKLSQLTALTAENEELRHLLELQRRVGVETLTSATVIGNAPTNFEWSIVIDQGSDDGVTPDMPVIAGAGLVGRVVQVTPGAATVQLIIDPESHVAARLAASRETGVLNGQGDNDLSLDLVDEDTDVQPGEEVVTAGYQLPSGQGGLYPPEIPIGEVSHVVPNESALTGDVFVRPNVDLADVSVVLLVRPAQEVPEVSAP